MNTVTIVWTVYENEGYWYYAFGSKQGALKTSGKFMTQAQAKKALDHEIELSKKQYSSSAEVVTQEMKH